tara:strand:- start:1732 stop:2148 length:417 start_codon:yes stop_codon:yes gene_type:complete
MAIINLIFNHDINVSVQVDDLVYFVPTTPIGVPGTLGNWAATTTPHDSAPRENVILIGPVTAFIPWNGVTTTIIADYDDAIAALYGPPTTLDFIMFSKDNKVNLSSLLGYYAKAQFRNDSTSEAELFTVAADFVESSK